MKTICFSSGLDSTSLLYDAFKDANEDFETIYFHLDNNTPTSNYEVLQRRKILAYLQSEYPTSRYKGDVVVKLNIDGGFKAFLAQSYVWVTQLVAYANPVDTIEFGYVKYDDYWHRRHLIEKAFNSSWKAYRDNAQPRPKFSYPYEWTYKVDIIASLSKDRHLFNMISYCESLENRKPCGKCSSCLRHKQGLDQVSEYDH